jgi:hypothetical protein
MLAEPPICAIGYATPILYLAVQIRVFGARRWTSRRAGVEFGDH